MAKTRLKLAVKLFLFIMAVSICVGAVNELLKPKYYYNQDWSATNTYKDFYKLEKNSLDVLIFGSSHAVSALNPQVIYDNFSITSYNLGSEQQSLVVTYYWLREALKYQSPKVVVLDTHMLHMYADAYVYNNMNCSESAVRKAMDNMRPSLLKLEAGLAIEEIDPAQSGLSFLLLNIRYHSRWNELGENDYIEKTMIDHGGIKGYTMLSGENPDMVYEPFKDADAEMEEPSEMVETSKMYMDKIVFLCEKEGIQLILINIPYAESINKYKSNKEYAQAHGLPYYDFNEEVLYNEIGYDASKDLLVHPNYLGAEKISMYIGKLLSAEYDILPREDASYESSRKLYEHGIENIQLTSTTDIYRYLDMINNDRYSVFVYAPVEFREYLDDDIMERLCALGFKAELMQAPEGCHYCAVKDSDDIIEKLTEDDINFSGSIRGGLTLYNFTIDTSIMLDSYQKFSMTVDGVQCGNRDRGIDIVVYDNEYKAIIDKINFDTTVRELTAYRY